MKKDSRIYIAGHRGLVGSAIKRRLHSHEYKNIITRNHSELDLTQQAAVENFFKEEKPEYVFLAAAKVGGILANDTYKADFIYDNIMIAANIVHASYKYGAKKLLNLGSSCIYPKLAEQPIKEESLLAGALEQTNEPYAIAKITALKLCRYYNEQYGTNFISVMPTNLYGPNDNYNLETSHVLPAFIRKFHLAKLLKDRDLESIKQDISINKLGFGLDVEVYNDQSIIRVLEKVGIAQDYVTLWGSGEVFREFLYVDDLAEASLFLIENVSYSDVGEIVNIGTGKDMKIKEIAELIRNIVGYDGDIRYDNLKPDGTPRKLLDVSKMKKLGWEAKTSIENGIKKSYEWYLAQRGRIDQN